ncbi:MAG: hypothetical protein M1830_006596 [Pleopsidium flavum]|nr:MAG: hypothetical protein M1830_006596 [Pleopsidium flavum]
MPRANKCRSLWCFCSRSLVQYDLTLPVHPAGQSIADRTFAHFTTCVTSIIRLNALNALTFEDITYTLADALMGTTIEPSIGIMNACLPMMRPLLIKIFPPGLFAKRSKGTGGAGSERFERLDEHACPLTGVEGIMINEVTSPNDSKLFHEATHSLKDVEYRDMITPADPRSGINVKTEWQVKHRGV